ncbi:hypothetical protein BCR44DRAFT_1424233 [Catenaria anguillulae PL171]|uniref:Uncharacterized protein n=1 Tax=Catenaria anguillulae PL171 TaxID=765915 RepID=A0A1Y2I2D7_9FUNG|nr:hypothetical protein BCR44DRAFT_1424233 [Catenaria anguillulae PL171]
MTGSTTQLATASAISHSSPDNNTRTAMVTAGTTFLSNSSLLFSANLTPYVTTSSAPWNNLIHASGFSLTASADPPFTSSDATCSTMADATSSKSNPPGIWSIRLNTASHSSTGPDRSALAMSFGRCSAATASA